MAVLLRIDGFPDLPAEATPAGVFDPEFVTVVSGFTAASTAALPLGGSATATVLEQAASTAALPLGGSATAQVLEQAASTAALPLGGAATATVLVQAVSSAALPLGGSATATASLQAVSSAPLPLGGSATVTSTMTAASAQALPLSGAVTVVTTMTAASAQALPLSGAVTVTVLDQAASTAALPLGGSITVTTGAAPVWIPPAVMNIPMRPTAGGFIVGRITGMGDTSNPLTGANVRTADSNAALPLGGSAFATVLDQATSVAALPLGGSATATVLVQATSNLPLPLGGTVTVTTGAPALVSNQPLPFGGSATATVLVQATSVAGLPLGGAVSALVALIANSNQPLPLGGTVAVGTLNQFVSIAGLPLGGSATARVGLTAASTAALPLSGLVQAAVGLLMQSNQPLPLSGASTATVVAASIASTIKALPLGGSITVLINAHETILPDPLSLSFDSLETGVIFYNDNGAPMGLTLRLRQGEVVPITFSLTANGKPADLTAVVPGQIKWTVERPGKTPIINNVALTIVGDPTLGKVRHNTISNDTATVGTFEAEVTALFNDGRTRKFPGEGIKATVIIGRTIT